MESTSLPKGCWGPPLVLTGSEKTGISVLQGKEGTKANNANELGS